MKNVRIRRALFVAGLLCSSMACDATEPESSAGGSAGADRTDAVYERSRLLQVEVELDPADWDALRLQDRTEFQLEDCLPPDAPFESPFTWFTGTVTVDGEVFEDVGVRKKGFFGSLSTERPSLKVRLDKYVDGRTFLDVKRLTLNNAQQDPSLVRQCLAYDVFRSVGAPTPRCNFAQVAVNGEDMGVFVNVESIKKPFIRRNFDDPEGNLYEGTLADFREGWTGTMEQKTNGSLPDTSAIDAITEALGLPDDELLDALRGPLDLDAFLSFWAAETLVSHWDGYAGNTNNFYFYDDPMSGRVHFIPWGTDGTFVPPIKLFEGEPAPRSINAAGLLARRLYLHPEGQAMYLERLSSLLDTHWDEAALQDSIDRMAEVFRPGLSASRLVEVEEGLAETEDFVSSHAHLIRGEIEGVPEAWNTPLREDLCGGEGGTSTTWGATVLLEEGVGTLEYYRNEPDGSACWMTADLIGPASVEACTECGFAMEMTISGLEVVDEADSVCLPGELAIDGRLATFGQSTVVLSVEKGVTYYNLMTLENDLWGPVPRGYSTLLGDIDSGTWYFGTY